MVIHNVGFYTVFTFLPSYFTKTLGFTKMDAFVSITIASVVALVLIPPLGALSDRIGRKPLLIAGSVGFIVFAYPLFLLLNSGSLAARSPDTPGWPRSRRCSCRRRWPQADELFATRVRSGAYSIGYNVSVAIFGGTAPYVATWLTDRTGNELAPAYYVIVAAVITLATVMTMRETSARPLRKLVAVAHPPIRPRMIADCGMSSTAINPLGSTADPVDRIDHPGRGGDASALRGVEHRMGYVGVDLHPRFALDDHPVDAGLTVGRVLPVGRRGLVSLVMCSMVITGDRRTPSAANRTAAICRVPPSSSCIRCARCNHGSVPLTNLVEFHTEIGRRDCAPGRPTAT